MVLRNLPIKLGIIQTSIFKPDNHGVKNQFADLKKKKMKKSRSVSKRIPEVSPQPRSPQRPLVGTPVTTASPKRQLLLSSPRKASMASSSPNYMKSTSSSEARKEQKKVSVTRMKKVRNLTKIPSFKHTTRSASNKVAFCAKFDVKKATCSSTQKESKFPSYLVLNPGGTEADGISAMKVCPYNYCSLNGHRHSNLPSLKCFLSARRKIMKTQKSLKPEAQSPCKPKPETEVDDQKDLLVEIYVKVDDLVKIEEDPHGKVFSNDSKQGTDRLFDEEKSEVDVKDDHQQKNDAFLSEERDENPREQDQEMELSAESSSSFSMDEFFGESSDMEWEERDDISIQSDAEYDKNCVYMSENDESFELENVGNGFFKECEEEIEQAQFSDAETISDDTSRSMEHSSSEELIAPGENSCTLVTSTTDKELVDEQDNLFFNYIDQSIQEKITARAKELDSPDVFSQKDGHEAKFDNTIEERTSENEQLHVLETREYLGFNEDTVSGPEDKESKHAGSIKTEEQQQFEPLLVLGDEGCMDKNELVETEQNEVEDEADKCIRTFSQGKKANIKYDHSEKQAYQAEKLAISTVDENHIEAEKGTESSDIIKPDAPETVLYIDDEFSNNGSASKWTIRRKSTVKDAEASRPFNPREPNFLELKPDQEAEKVDLRHQEMDERKNADEWMLDHALQKAVNQLAPARMRKVALLVEAFETVMPAAKCEPRLRQNSAGFALARPIQACN